MSELARRLLAGNKSRSMSEDEVQFGFNPIDELRRTVNTQTYTPEQAAQNRKASLWEALSVTPGPGNVISAHDAYTGAGDAYNAFSAGDYKGGALASALAGLSGAGAVLGLPFGKFAKGAADAGQDTLNIFAGPMVKTADHGALAKAQEMVQAGASRDDIWRDTGWFQGVDGKWRFEIDDSAAGLTPLVKERLLRTDEGLSAYRGNISGGFEHPDLYRAYEESTPFRSEYDLRKGPGGGTYHENNDKLVAAGRRPEQARSVTLHELQHGVQAREGFGLGGSIDRANVEKARARVGVEELADKAERLQNAMGDEASVVLSRAERGEPQDRNFVSQAVAKWQQKFGVKSSENPHGIDAKEAVQFELIEQDEQINLILKQLNEAKALNLSSPDDIYRRMAGEVEARNVQSRMNMSAAERRAKAPWLTQDVSDDHQIIRYR